MCLSVEVCFSEVVFFLAEVCFSVYVFVSGGVFFNVSVFQCSRVLKCNYVFFSVCFSV